MFDNLEECFCHSWVLCMVQQHFLFLEFFDFKIFFQRYSKYATNICVLFRSFLWRFSFLKFIFTKFLKSSDNVPTPSLDPRRLPPFFFGGASTVRRRNNAAYTNCSLALIKPHAVVQGIAGGHAPTSHRAPLGSATWVSGGSGRNPPLII